MSRRSIVITPICPHSLSDRSLVLGDDSLIELKANQRHSDSILFTVDGREVLQLGDSGIVRVERAPAPLKIVRLPNHSFYETLRGSSGGQAARQGGSFRVEENRMRYEQIDSVLFTRNRSRLSELMEPGAMAIVTLMTFSQPMRTACYLSQNRDLYYLSGVDQRSRS